MIFDRQIAKQEKITKFHELHDKYKERKQHKTLKKKNHKCQFCLHIETRQLICTANQLTGFYMRSTLAHNGSNDMDKKIK